MTIIQKNMSDIKFRMKSLESYIKESGGKVNLDDVVNVINIHHKKENGTRYLRQWEAYMGRKAKGCANLDCDNHQKCDSLVGAHVKIEGDERTWYITPLCHVCNSDDNNDPMPVRKEDLALYMDVKDIG